MFIYNNVQNGRTLLVSILFFVLLALQNGGRIDQMVTFGPSDTEIAINFTVIDDLIALEPTETFDWTLTLVTLVDRANVQPFNRTTIEILDNDGKFFLLLLSNIELEISYQPSANFQPFSPFVKFGQTLCPGNNS